MSILSDINIVTPAFFELTLTSASEDKEEAKRNIWGKGCSVLTFSHPPHHFICSHLVSTLWSSGCCAFLWPTSEIWDQNIGVRFGNIPSSQACKASTGGPSTTHGDMMDVSLWGAWREYHGRKSLMCGSSKCQFSQHTLQTLGAKHHPFTSRQGTQILSEMLHLCAESLGLFRDGPPRGNSYNYLGGSTHSWTTLPGHLSKA